MKQRILKRLLRQRLVRRFSFTLTLRADGRRARVPIINGVGLAYLKPHEPMMPRIYQALLALRPGLFLDVGMNLGQTLIKVKAIDPHQPVLGFEPNAASVVCIDELIRLNGYSGVRVVPVGLSDRDQLAELQTYHEDPADGSASMVKGFRPTDIRRVDSIVCLSFDTVERSVPIEKIGLVKIDVEGAESLVLAGMSRRLRKDRPIVVVEILPAYDAKNVDRLERQRTIEALTRELDYRIIRAPEDEDEDLRLDPLTEIGIHDRIDWSTYLLVPEELVEAVKLAIDAPAKAAVPSALSS
jgi:FkbM family methyltransferase